jgi:hypothetical protein
LIAGGKTGETSNDHVEDTAEIFDPSTGKFSLTGSLNAARFEHSAVLLPTGLVLLGWGVSFTTPGNFSAVNTAELYNPLTGEFTFTPTAPLYLHAAAPDLILLPTGGC